MTFRMIAASAAMLLLAACGGGDRNLHASLSAYEAPPFSTSFQQSATASSASTIYPSVGFPYTYLDDVPYYTIGADAAAQDMEELDAIGEYDDIAIAWGHDRSGVGRYVLLRELRDSIRESNAGSVMRWLKPPVVRVAHGTSDDLLWETHNVVAMINTALPVDFQLAFDFEPAPRGADTEAEGEIMITFAPQHEWPANSRHLDALGVSYQWHWDSGELTTAPIWIDADESAQA